MTRTLKCVLVGDEHVGKTSLLVSYTTGQPHSGNTPPMFSGYCSDVVVEGSSYSFSLWDTAGDPAYDRLRVLVYPDTAVTLLCFSVANPHSFASVKSRWLPEVREYAPHSALVLVGLKTDLREDEPAVTQHQATRCAAEIGAQCYVECSPRTFEGVRDVFFAAICAGALNHRRRKGRPCTLM
eukprot:GCRY01005273.1.p1 GENE.GCRY01005273.1~~GCRY01005273.1.p1  ORF type:complete len:182 (-),score=22.99 GCRY01005273.1:266-811(-)